MAKIGIAISSGCNGSHVNIGKGMKQRMSISLTEKWLKLSALSRFHQLTFLFQQKPMTLWVRGPGQIPTVGMVVISTQEVKM